MCCYISQCVVYLVFLKSFNHVFAASQETEACPLVDIVLETHITPGLVQRLDHLLHGELLACLLHQVMHLVLKVVQVEADQVGQQGGVSHHKLYFRFPHKLDRR